MISFLGAPENVLREIECVVNQLTDSQLLALYERLVDTDIEFDMWNKGRCFYGHVSHVTGATYKNLQNKSKIMMYGDLSEDIMYTPLESYFMIDHEYRGGGNVSAQEHITLLLQYFLKNRGYISE